ncbi:MAG: hypothetical protein AAFO61_02135 [Pseudomonadota bacterium]
MRIALIAAALMLTNPAMAERVAEDDRYFVVQTEKGSIRVDRQSGAVSYCREAAGSVVCSMAADERAAWRDEMERMAARIDALEAKLASNTPAPTKKTPAPTKGSEDGLDKAMDKVEGLMRRMIDVAKDAKENWEKN